MASTRLPASQNGNGSNIVRGGTGAGNSADSGGVIISDAMLLAFSNVCLVVDPFLLLWALIAGALNTVTFLKMGITDGIGQNFLILSISDATLGFLQSVSTAYRIMDSTDYQPAGPLASRTVKTLVRMAINIPMTCSLITTTVIAIVRCCLVTFPLHARQIVTARRQLAVIVSLSVVATVVYIYGFTAAQSLIERTDRKSGVTKWYIAINPSIKSWMDVLDTMKNFYFYVCLIVIFLSMVILTISLSKVTRFREMASAGQSANTKAVRKEIQVVKCVVIVLLIFFVCYLPFTLLSLLRRWIPGFQQNQRFGNENSALNQLSVISLEINIGCNLFVYLYFNSRFRNTFKAMLYCAISKDPRDKKDDAKDEKSLACQEANK